MKLVSMWAEENHKCHEAEFSLLNYGERSVKRWGQGIENGMIFVKDSNAEFFISEEDLIKEGENWGKFFMNKEKFGNFLEAVKDSSEEISQQVKRIIETDLTKISNKELFQMHVDYSRATGKIMGCYIVTQPHRIAGVEKKLKTFLEEKGVSDVNDYFIKLTSYEKKVVFSEKGNDIFRKTISELIKQGEINKEIAGELYREEETDSGEKNKIIEELNPDEEIKHVIKVLSILGHERLKMRMAWMPSLYFYEMFVKEIGRRYEIAGQELDEYLEGEIEELILTGQKVDEKILDERKKGFLKVLENGAIKSYQGDESVKVLESFVKKEEFNNELRGMVASKGRVVGRAVIFSYKNPKEHSDKIKAMKEGSIIVSEMTRPNLIQAFEKAAAIITDEGGITSHAAIVSREFNIPTIVGTRIATKVIKDGDWLEVDAENGIVRRLEK